MSPLFGRVEPFVQFGRGTVSESGTGPLDYGATGPVPDSESSL